LAGGPGAAENDEDEDDPQHGGDMGRLGRSRGVLRAWGNLWVRSVLEF